MDGVKTFVPKDVRIENGFKMTQTYINGLNQLLTVVDPISSPYLDDYCRGMIFGLNGTNILFKIATILRNQELPKFEYVPA